MKKNKKRDYNKLAKLYALIPFITLLIMKVYGTIIIRKAKVFSGIII